MEELLLRAESLLKLAGHYLEPVRLVIFFYKTFRWLIKLPGRAVNAYREVRDWFRFLRDFPQRMAEAIAADFVSRIGRAVAVIGLAALFGTALMILVAAKGSTRVG